MTSPLSPSEAIRQLCLDAGACATGFARAVDLGEPSRSFYARWIADGCHASMGYLEKYADLRPDPSTLLAGARTVISLAFSYRRPPGAQPHPLIADYALGSDYHTALRERLEPVASAIAQIFPGAESRICIDTAPIHERLWAVRAGLGFIGKNSMLIVPRAGAGSRVFLAEIITSAELTPDTPLHFDQDPCHDCDRCLKACPGGAITPRRLDSRRCYSFHTIENRAEALPSFVKLRGRKIYGCDCCQDACPFNSEPYTGPLLPEFEPRPELYTLRTAADIAKLTHPDYLRLFKDSAIRRAKLPHLHRNAKAAACPPSSDS